MRAVGRKTESQSGLKPGSHSNEKHECILIFKSKNHVLKANHPTKNEEQS